jgi:hypothetical protein
MLTAATPNAAIPTAVITAAAENTAPRRLGPVLTMSETLPSESFLSLLALEFQIILSLLAVHYIRS